MEANIFKSLRKKILIVKLCYQTEQELNICSERKEMHEVALQLK